MGLGCGRVGALVVERGDWTSMVTNLSQDIAEASCDRRLNDVSQASMTVRDCYTGPAIVPWEHALLLTWDGDFLWAGPIIGVRDAADGTGIIEARDIMEWMRHRKIRTTYNSVGAAADVTTIFSNLVSNGFNQDASVAYTISSAVTGITAERKYTAGVAGLVYDAVAELASTGIDWTVILDIITCGDVDIPATAIGVLNNSHLVRKPELAYEGLEQGNFITLFGRDVGDSGTQLSGLAQDAGSQTTYGLLDRIENEEEMRDQTSLDAAAASRLDLRLNAPITIGELELADTAPLSMSEIVPGAVLSTWLEGRFITYIGDVRLESAVFTADSGQWRSKLRAQPVGTVG